MNCPTLGDDCQSWLVNRRKHVGDLFPPMGNYTVPTNECNARGMAAAVVVCTPVAALLYTSMR
jgi:hypothetical protein